MGLGPESLSESGFLVNSNGPRELELWRPAGFVLRRRAW